MSDTMRNKVSRHSPGDNGGVVKRVEDAMGS